MISDLSMERGDGFQGPIIISDPENEDEKQLEEMYDGDEVVFLQDWYHLDGQTRRTGEFFPCPFIFIDFVAQRLHSSPYIAYSSPQASTATLSFGLEMHKRFSSMAAVSTLHV